MYKVIRNVITKEHAAILTGVVRANPVREGDECVPDGYSWGNLPVMNILLGLLCDRVSLEAGKTLVPAYSYCRLYKHENKLEKHKDRPSCEWSVTLNLSQDASWPIFMEGTPLTLDVGDMCLYQGCQVEHWREPFKGQEYIQVFLHYVDVNGPYKEYMYDLKDKQQLISYRYTRPDNTNRWWKAPNVFTKQECRKIIDLFNGTTELAKVGNGRTDSDIRKSDIRWIPKTVEFEWIYMRVFQVVGNANETFFNMDISEIREDIQYTEYENGYYNWHVDINKSERKLSASIQLSDPSDYEGGELQFDDNGGVADKEQGTLVVFPSYLRHRVTEVTKGRRCALVTWIAGPPLR